jgi:hypothetical protein
VNRRVAAVLAASACLAGIVATGWVVLHHPEPVSGASAQVDYLFYNDQGSDHLGVTVSGTGEAWFAWAVPSLGVAVPSRPIGLHKSKGGSSLFSYEGAGSIVPADVDTLSAIDIPQGGPDIPVQLRFQAEVAKDGNSASATLWITPASVGAEDETAASPVVPRHLVLTSRRNVGRADNTVMRLAMAIQSGDCGTLYDAATDEWQASMDRESFISQCPAALTYYGQLTRVALSSEGLAYGMEANRPVASGKLILTVGSDASARQLTATIDLLWQGGRWRLKSISPAQ